MGTDGEMWFAAKEQLPVEVGSQCGQAAQIDLVIHGANIAALYDGFSGLGELGFKGEDGLRRCRGGLGFVAKEFEHAGYVPEEFLAEQLGARIVVEVRVAIGK